MTQTKQKMRRTLKQKIQYSLEARGLLGTLQHCKSRIGDTIREYIDHGFDRRFGTDTSGNIELSELTIESKNVPDGIWYEPIPTKTFRQIMNRLKMKHEDFIFVDFGSGKGRALLLASDYGFKQIVGIEFAPELHRTAQENIRLYQGKRQKCFDITSLCMDAVDYPIPNEQAVFFFFSPFKPRVMAAVLGNIRESLEAFPRRICLVFYGSRPETIHLMEEMGLDKEELSLSYDYSTPVQRRALIFSN